MPAPWGETLPFGGSADHLAVSGRDPRCSGPRGAGFASKAPTMTRNRDGCEVGASLADARGGVVDGSEWALENGDRERRTEGARRERRIAVRVGRASPAKPLQKNPPFLSCPMKKLERKLLSAGGD